VTNLTKVLHIAMGHRFGSPRVHFLDQYSGIFLRVEMMGTYTAQPMSRLYGTESESFIMVFDH